MAAKPAHVFDDVTDVLISAHGSDLGRPFEILWKQFASLQPFSLALLTPCSESQALKQIGGIVTD
jgi:hypothetical protein